MSHKYERQAISKFGTEFRMYKEDEWLFPCPMCKKLNTDNLHVNPITGQFHCFHCDYGGHLKSKAEISDLIDKNCRDIKQNKTKITILLPFNRQKLTEEQHQALLNRGLTDDDIKYYDISGGKRIQIPNFVMGNLSDLICFWEYRKDRVNKKNPKYLYSSDVKKSDCLFNAHKIKKKSHITLCEGIFNAITAGRNAVASYGRSLSDEQLKILLNCEPNLITIAYDSDLPGVTGAVEVIRKLMDSNYVGKVDYILLPKGLDINDLGKQNYKDYYNKNKVNIDLQSNLSLKIPMLLYNSRTTRS